MQLNRAIQTEHVLLRLTSYVMEFLIRPSALSILLEAVADSPQQHRLVYRATVSLLSEACNCAEVSILAAASFNALVFSQLHCGAACGSVAGGHQSASDCLIPLCHPLKASVQYPCPPLQSFGHLA